VGGRLDEARDHVQILQRRCMERGADTDMLLAARGDVDGAERMVRKAIAEHARLPMPFERARTLLLLGQLQRRKRQKQAPQRL
jgi:hypothetical protein